MTNANRNLLGSSPFPWMAGLLALAGAGLLLGAFEPVIRVLGLPLLLGGAGWMLAVFRNNRARMDQLLAAIPLPDKSEALLRELPRAWSELEQKNRALEAQVREEDQIRTGVLAHLRVGIVLLGSDRTVATFNPAAQTILGSSSRLSPGSSLLAIFREPDSHRMLSGAFQGEGAEWDLRREPRIIHCRAVSLAAPGGEGPVLLTLENITRQEALETTRQKFISNASHELKTPTTSIRIATENLLEGGQVSTEGIPNLHSILRSVDRMTMLLNDISELSRIETGALVLRPEEIQVDEFMDSLLDEWRAQAKARRIRIRMHLPEELRGFAIQTDPLRLSQILDNLVSNAIKFSPEDSEVSVQMLREGRWLCWSVSDQGPGIAPSESQRIFERFYRSPQARGVPGTGLGLSIVKHLCALMEAEIAVESELGRGATFTLRTPLAETTI